ASVDLTRSGALAAGRGDRDVPGADGAARANDDGLACRLRGHRSCAAGGRDALSRAAWRRSRPLTNPTQDRGSVELLVWCSWRLEDGPRVLSSISCFRSFVTTSGPIR